MTTIYWDEIGWNVVIIMRSQLMKQQCKNNPLNNRTSTSGQVSGVITAAAMRNKMLLHFITLSSTNEGITASLTPSLGIV